MSTAQGKLLTVAEAKERLRCSGSLVYQLAEEKELESVRIGGKGRRGKLLIPEAAIDAYITKHTVKSKQDAD